MESTTFSQTLFRFLIDHKRSVIMFFWFFYISIIISMVLAWNAFGTAFYFYYEILAVRSGYVAVIAFAFSLAPGIFRRLAIRHPLLQIIMLFRRQIGLLMFCTAAFHGFVYRTLSVILVGMPAGGVLPLYELFGMISLNFLLLPLALTSNDWSVQHMGIWWKRLHMLSYIAVWTVFGHLMLIERFSLWSLIIGLVGVGEIISWSYYWRSKQNG